MSDKKYNKKAHIEKRMAIYDRMVQEQQMKVLKLLAARSWKAELASRKLAKMAIRLQDHQRDLAVLCCENLVHA